VSNLSRKCPESVQFLSKIFNLNVLAIYIFDFIVLNVQKMSRNISENTLKCSENVQKRFWKHPEMFRKCSETFLKHPEMSRKRPENVQKMSRKCSEKCPFF
jgi:hypothetical protein